MQVSVNPENVPDVHKQYSSQHTHIQHTDAEGNVTKENYATADPRYNEKATLTKYVKRNLGDPPGGFPSTKDMDASVNRPSDNDDGFKFNTVNEKRSGYKAGE